MARSATRTLVDDTPKKGKNSVKLYTINESINQSVMMSYNMLLSREIALFSGIICFWQDLVLFKRDIQSKRSIITVTSWNTTNQMLLPTDTFSTVQLLVMWVCILKEAMLRTRLMFNSTQSIVNFQNTFTQLQNSQVVLP